MVVTGFGPDGRGGQYLEIENSWCSDWAYLGIARIRWNLITNFYIIADVIKINYSFLRETKLSPTNYGAFICGKWGGKGKTINAVDPSSNEVWF